MKTSHTRPSCYRPLVSLVVVTALLSTAQSANAWQWTPWSQAQGDTMPPGSFIGGTEQVIGENRTRQLFVCQLDGGPPGIHPAKVVAGRCNIRYDSKEK